MSEYGRKSNNHNLTTNKQKFSNNINHNEHQSGSMEQQIYHNHVWIFSSAFQVVHWAAGTETLFDILELYWYFLYKIISWRNDLQHNLNYWNRLYSEGKLRVRIIIQGYGCYNANLPLFNEYLLRMLRSQGLPANNINTVFITLVISRILHALGLHVWGVFLSAGQCSKIDE